MRRSSSRLAWLLFLALLALPLTAASSCNRKVGTGAAATRSPGMSVYTPRPIPPTTTIRPGEPTRMPVLPG